MRDESIRRLQFPYGSYRPGQREMAVAVYRTVKNSGQFLAQAATGIGKTMAVIFPAVKAIAEGLNTKIFYLTARTTGKIAAEKALDELRKNHLKLKSLTITAKDKICFKPEDACNPKECEFACGYFDRINEALNDIFQQDSFTRKAVESAARSHQVCPFEFSLELSYWADCIICDYNYAFDPRVYLRRFFQEKNNDYTFLIDEAHNLVDRAREMFSAEIFKQQILDVRRAIRSETPRIFKILGQINAWLVKQRKRCEKHGNARHEKQPPDELYPMLSGFISMTERWLYRNIKAAFREELLDLFFAVSGFLRVAEKILRAGSQLLVDSVRHIRVSQQTRATHRRAYNGEMNPRLVHDAKYLVLDVVERIGLTGNDQMQVVPDVVAKQSRGVISNATGRVFPQDAPHRDRVVRIDPKR